MKLPKHRMESLSDGVMSIVMTIMVLNIPLPTHFDLNGLEKLSASVLVYLISFFIVGSFWYQHYRLFSGIGEITARLGWCNLFFLFSLSLLPFTTKMIVENFGEVFPACGYIIVFLLVNISYHLMLAEAVRGSVKLIRRIPWPFQLFHIVVWLISMSAALVLALFYPKLAESALIGLPLLLSLSNIWFESDKRFSKIDPAENRRRPGPRLRWPAVTGHPSR